MIASDVKFNNGPLEEEKPKSRKSVTELQKKQEEEYNNEAHEQRYKRLMHLLNKSQFYSSYLLNKVESNKKKKVTRKNKIPSINDENIPPKAKKKRVVENYNIEEYISKEVSSKIWILLDNHHLITDMI